MEQVRTSVDESVYARLSRFALCIASSSATAFGALDAMDDGLRASSDDRIREAFRALLSRLDEASRDDPDLSGQPPRSFVARFSFLPYHQRVAFALVVIEEFSVEDAAEIMALSIDDVRRLLLATRDFLFATQWTARSDG
ncbi:hypothetical protein [Parvularcula mediterranea]|uniref:hypothetical protein n=1 Tax=Parvularcula mediterranea TaxID=2732508 RepID=UPI00156639E3|nr:hypothetical protein [Parvularcula mediterranea]